jgi:hypothetical protein
VSPTETIVAQEPETSTQPLPSAKEAPPPSTETAPQDGDGQDLRGLGRQALDSAERSMPDVAEVPAPAPQPAAGEDEEQDESRFDLGRVAWLATVLSCLLTVAILVLDGYVGYAAVALAVALAAAINLL